MFGSLEPDSTLLWLAPSPETAFHASAVTRQPELAESLIAHAFGYLDAAIYAYFKLCQMFFSKKEEELLHSSPFMVWDGNQTVANLGPNLASFAANPSDMLTRCFGSLVAGAEFVLLAPLSLLIKSSFSFNISACALTRAWSFL